MQQQRALTHTATHTTQDLAWAEVLGRATRSQPVSQGWVTRMGSGECTNQWHAEGGREYISKGFASVPRTL